MQQETIEGVVESVIFHNPDTGWTVLSLVPQDTSRFDDEVTVVGKMIELQPGETVKFSGVWTTHKDYGDQFKANSVHLVTTTVDSLQKFLASGLIEGIGKQTAKQI